MERTLEWLASNHELAALIVSLCMLLVWITYLQIFFAGFRRQRRGSILITLGQGEGLDGHCLVTNMGAEPVYILALIAQVEGDCGVRSRAITEPEGERWSEPSELHLWTRQGPLDSSELRDMGALRSMVDHVLGAGAGIEPDDRDPRRSTAGLRSVVIRVVAMHGSEDLPIGAERAFDIVQGGADPKLHPRTYGTHQIRARRERRRLTRLLDEHAGYSARR